MFFQALSTALHFMWDSSSPSDLARGDASAALAPKETTAATIRIEASFSRILF
jgi:hypothetical protein